MARTRERSQSPESGIDESVVKRLKTSHIHADSLSLSQKPAQQFHPDLFDHNNIARLSADYQANRPFKYSVVDKLFQDDLLQKVKDECLGELSFTEKETDIYKVNQTGDLASLSYLDKSQISRLPALLTLRDALYSPQFRQFLRSVTGCGPLSGKKQDMSVNSYTRGCHLLNHDDVIGTRRVSYILYMPLPNYQLWQKDWGGALELYPVQLNKDGQFEPEAVPSKSIPPSWNQFIFFEVQPGKSFHSVEEVVVGGEGEDGRTRLSISGWFHAAQEGEEGYVPEPPTESKSSREQLASTSTVFHDYTAEPDTIEDDELAPADIAFLSEYLNPVYLKKRTMQALGARFVKESSLELHSFLRNDLAESMEPRLRGLDNKDGLGEDRAGRIPPHSAGTSGNWHIKGPPHKWRYCALRSKHQGSPIEAVVPLSAAPIDEIMRALQDDLFSSPAFRAWLAVVSKLMPMRHSVEARRFRPGLDYTLATSEEKEARLDVVLGLTPALREADSDEEERFIKKHGAMKGWQSASWGGWECYMAPHNEEDDPAVYRSGSARKPRDGHDSDGDETMDEEEEDATLLTVQPGFNRLLLVLRDERVMRFVKYVSAASEGSRWDICAEYEVGMMEEDDEDDASSVHLNGNGHHEAES